MKRKILTTIPCYNSEKFVERVVKDVMKYIKDILVVDDGSKDNSLNKIKKIKNIDYLVHKKNKGKGAALKTGFAYAIKKRYDAVLTIDSDYQHKPYDIPKFLDVYDNYDIILGSRMHNTKNMPLRRVLANKISSYLTSKRCRQKITDSQSGYRLIKIEVLKDVNLKRNDYQMETEILLKAAEKGYKIGEVDIDTIYGSEVSHINPFLITIKFFKTLFSK